jgi:hypothetical protein
VGQQTRVHLLRVQLVPVPVVSLRNRRARVSTVRVACLVQALAGRMWTWGRPGLQALSRSLRLAAQALNLTGSPHDMVRMHLSPTYPSRWWAPEPVS